MSGTQNWLFLGGNPNRQLRQKPMHAQPTNEISAALFRMLKRHRGNCICFALLNVKLKIFADVAEVNVFLSKI